jgi:hypothetical protein
MQTNRLGRWSARIVLSLASVACCFNCCFGATSILTASSAAASPGSTISISISFTPGSGSAGALQWTLNMPPAVASYTVQSGPAASSAGKSLSCNGNTCLLAGLNRSPIGAGVVATITAAIATRAAGSSLLQLSNPVEAELDGSAGSIATTPGSLTISNPVSVAITLSPSLATLSAGQTAQFSATVSGASNTAVTWSLNPPLGSVNAGLYTAPTVITSTQTVTVTATSVADATKSASAIVTLTPPTSLSSSTPAGISIWPASATPAIFIPTYAPIELGVKFRSDVAGTITGIRFYKAPGDNSQHTGSLWSSTGALLATGVFTNETASGWQQLTFTTPVAIAANTTYIASYHTNGLAIDVGYFRTHGFDNRPLHALQSGVDGANGVYLYGPGGQFPSNSSDNNNYWVDVTFTPGAVDAPPPEFSIWPNSATPSVPFYSDSPVELGVKFRSDVAGIITGIRFYKGAGNTGVHTGSLWSSAGALLATGTFTNETATGWQTLTFATPVAIAANTTYIASYHTNTGFAYDASYFATQGVDNPPLHALKYGVDGGNGVYIYGPGGKFPTSFTSNNYWVDVVFSTTSGNSPAFSSIWPNDVSPSLPFYADNPVELGVKFRSDVAGKIAGIRFYKNPSNTGVHTGSLWSANGTLLATGTFTKETASGWQTLWFTTPVAIAANTTYIASYHTNTGFSVDVGSFQIQGADNPPLHALQVGVDGANGVFRYGPGGVFPSSASTGSNYWVDVIFTQ